MKWLASLTLAALTAGAFGLSFAQGGMDKADTNAMKKLAQANLAEVQAGKLAVSKAESSDVKQFGQRMVDDHGKMLDDLKQLASSKNVTLPTQPASKDQKTIQSLQKLSGEQFDRRYMSDMVKDHKKDVKETASIAKKAKDQDFKAAVEQAHAKIQEHLQMAQQIAKSEKKEAASGSSASGKK